MGLKGCTGFFDFYFLVGMGGENTSNRCYTTNCVWRQHHLPPIQGSLWGLGVNSTMDLWCVLGDGLLAGFCPLFSPFSSFLFYYPYGYLHTPTHFITVFLTFTLSWAETNIVLLRPPRGYNRSSVKWLQKLGHEKSRSFSWNSWDPFLSRLSHHVGIQGSWLGWRAGNTTQKCDLKNSWSWVPLSRHFFLLPP